MSDVAISEFLGSLGLHGQDAERARVVFEAEGITNPRKTRLSAAKLERARAAIDARFARFARYCSACAARTDAGGREVVTVPAGACTRCGGSRNERALAELAEACASAGIARIVVVGGSPDIRRELGALRGALELRLVDGTERRTRAEAQRDLAWADLVVIGGSSELGHKVSSLYTRNPGGTPVVTVARRGIEAIAAAVVEHARRRTNPRKLVAVSSPSPNVVADAVRRGRRVLRASRAAATARAGAARAGGPRELDHDRRVAATVASRPRLRVDALADRAAAVRGTRGLVALLARQQRSLASLRVGAGVARPRASARGDRRRSDGHLLGLSRPAPSLHLTYAVSR